MPHLAASGAAFLQEARPEDVRRRGALAQLTQPRRIRARVPPTQVVAVASRSHRDPETDAFLRERSITEIVSAGSSLKFCLVASGEADIYPRFGTTMEWDTAAGQAVLEAAGGSVLEVSGASLRYGKFEAGLKNPHFIARGRGPVS